MLRSSSSPRCHSSLNKRKVEGQKLKRQTMALKRETPAVSARGGEKRLPKRGSGAGSTNLANRRDNSASLVPKNLTVTTNKEDELHHLLDDDDLITLENLAADPSRDWFFALGAITIGTLQNVYNFIGDLYAKKAPTPFDGFMCVIFAACLVGSVIKGHEFIRNRPRLAAKIKSIRERPKRII
jgi:hypothetical protein